MVRIQPRFLSCEQEEANDSQYQIARPQTVSENFSRYCQSKVLRLQHESHFPHSHYSSFPVPPAHTHWRTWKSRRIFLIHTPSGLLSYRSNTSVMRLADRHWLSKSVVPLLLQAWWLSPTASRASLPRYLFSQSGGGWGISLPPPCSSPPPNPSRIPLTESETGALTFTLTLMGTNAKGAQHPSQ